MLEGAHKVDAAGSPVSVCSYDVARSSSPGGIALQVLCRGKHGRRERERYVYHAYIQRQSKVGEDNWATKNCGAIALDMFFMCMGM